MANMNLVIQPKFAEQIQTLPSPMGVNIPLQRGYMIWGLKGGGLGYTGGPFGDGRDVIRFLYNPSTVSTDYNIASSSLQAAMMYTVPGDEGNLLAPLLEQTVSWQLYFDRTYELNYGKNSSAINDPTVIGVQADVYQFMQFTGVLATLNKQQAQQIQSAGGATVGSATNYTASAVQTGGIMMMMPCYVFFGSALAQMNSNPNSSNFNALQSQLQFYGYISEWSVNYTHFTASMVPIRAAVSITFTMLPNAPSSTATAVWKDLQKMGQAPYTTTPPYAPGYTPTAVNGGYVAPSTVAGAL